ncbi:MAG: DUF3256 family protein [Prevotella sp.]|jgi:hypothetical protein
MKQKLYMLLSMLLAFVSVSAGNIKDVWTATPNSITPYLNKELREKLVTFNQTGSNPSVENLFGGTTSLDTLTDNFLQVKMSDYSTLQMKLLPRAEGDTLVCVVKTVSGTEKHSEVSFYNLSWSPLDIKVPEKTLPQRPDTMSVENYNRLIKMMDGRMTYAQLHPEDNNLTVGFSIFYATVDELKELKSFNKENVLVWDGKQFR